MTAQADETRALIRRLIAESGARDAESAMRLRATRAIDAFVMAFGEPSSMPLNLMQLASFLGIRQSGTMPAFSPDAELAPDGTGGMELRINPDRPNTRQRFSIGHEIAHTFFPDHQSHLWPRADSRYRQLHNPMDELEKLCDIGAAELLLPRRWFIGELNTVTNADGLVALAAKYVASREATIRRYAELHSEPVAAVFLDWQLKPTQQSTVGARDQINIFGTDPEAERLAALRLRVSYVIPSESFTSLGHYLPRDKSLDLLGALHDAAVGGLPADGTQILDLGSARGAYRVHAIPLWTAVVDRGPNGEYAVAAVIRPLDLALPRTKRRPNEPGFFD